MDMGFPWDITFDETDRIRKTNECFASAPGHRPPVSSYHQGGTSTVIPVSRVKGRKSITDSGYDQDRPDMVVASISTELHTENFLVTETPAYGFTTFEHPEDLCSSNQEENTARRRMNKLEWNLMMPWIADRYRNATARLIGEELRAKGLDVS